MSPSPPSAYSLAGAGFNKPKRIESLYVLKALCAFFVISIHVPHVERILMPIAGVGTPCFLCITGYLLYSADRVKEMAKCKAWAMKSFWLAVVCNIIYAVSYIWFFGRELPFDSWKFYVNLVFFGMAVNGFLWYLTALFWALLILRYVIRFRPGVINYLPLLFIIAFVLRTIDAMPEITREMPVNPTLLRNTCLVTSLPFLATGYLIRRHQEYLVRKINLNIALPLTLFLLVLEFYLRKMFFLPPSYFLLCTYPCIVFLMLLCIKYPDFTIPVVGNIGKHHSPNIYYFHGLFVVLSIQQNLGHWNTYGLTALIYCACIPCSFVYNYLSAKWKMRFWLPLVERLSLLVCKA